MTVMLTVVGAAGRMGRRIITLAVEDKDFKIVGAVEQSGHTDIGKDVGILAGIGPLGVKLSGSYPGGAEVVVDFSIPEAAEATIQHCLQQRCGLVLGTTGLMDQHRRRISEAARQIPILYGTNMSIGMNMLFFLVGKVAQMLGEDYDIEIVEEHHRFKKDAPSGSALTLAESVCKATGRDFPACLTHGRSGKDALRAKGTIGMHAVRAGDITGVHSVIFGAIGETVTLNHTALSRDTFVRGALRAARWIAGRNPGLYSMADVLGIF